MKFISLPAGSAHSGHPTESAGIFAQKLHPLVSQKILEMVRSGISDTHLSDIHLLTQPWWYCVIGKKATPKNKIYVPQNVFTATKRNHLELSFHGNHYNGVVPTEGVVPPL